MSRCSDFVEGPPPILEAMVPRREAELRLSARRERRELAGLAVFVESFQGEEKRRYPERLSMARRLNRLTNQSCLRRPSLHIYTTYFLPPPGNNMSPHYDDVVLQAARIRRVIDNQSTQVRLPPLGR